MKVTIMCENCCTAIELVPITNGQHAHMNKIEEHFRISKIELNFDHDVDEIEDVTAEVEEIRIDCTNCDNYIVLNYFPNRVY